MAATIPTTSGGRHHRLPPVTIVARESGSTLCSSHITINSPIAVDLSTSDEALSVCCKTPWKRKWVSTPFSESPPPVVQSSKRLCSYPVDPEMIELTSDSDESLANSPLFHPPSKVKRPSPSPLIKRQSTLRSTSEQSHAPDSNSSYSNSIPSKTTWHHWPAHYHAIHVVAFFDNVDNHPKETTEHIFAQHFPNTEFQCTTYYDNRWRGAEWFRVHIDTDDVVVKTEIIQTWCNEVSRCVTDPRTPM